MSKVDACGAGSRARSSPAGRDRLQPGRARPAPWNPRSWRGEAKRPRRAEAGPARRRDGEARGRRRTREVEGEAHSNSLSRVRIFSWSCWRRTREVEGEARGRQRGGSGLDGAVLRGAESRAPGRLSASQPSRPSVALGPRVAGPSPEARPTGRGPLSPLEGLKGRGTREPRGSRGSRSPTRVAGRAGGRWGGGPGAGERTGRRAGTGPTPRLARLPPATHREPSPRDGTTRHVTQSESQTEIHATQSESQTEIRAGKPDLGGRDGESRHARRCRRRCAARVVVSATVRAR